MDLKENEVEASRTILGATWTYGRTEGNVSYCITYEDISCVLNYYLLINVEINNHILYLFLTLLLAAAQLQATLADLRSSGVSLVLFIHYVT